MRNFKKITTLSLAAFLLTCNMELPIANAQEEKITTSYSSNLADTTAPTIDLDSIKLDTTNVKPNDTINISLKADDDMSGITSVYMFYTSSASIYRYKSVYLNYNSSTNLYEASIDIDTYMETGDWNLDFISVTDNSGNNTSIYSDRFSIPDTTTHDFSNLSFTVTNPINDTTAPTIDLDSIKIDKTNVNINDKINISLKAYDDISGITSVYVFYTSASSIYKYKSVYLNYNSSTGLYETSIDIDSSMENDTWNVDFISLTDNCANNTCIYSDRFNFADTIRHDLSNLSFTVSNK